MANNRKKTIQQKPANDSHEENLSYEEQGEDQANDSHKENSGMYKLRANLWYSVDKNGFIARLFAKAHLLIVNEGVEEFNGRVDLQRELSEGDIDGAEIFSVPERYHVYLAIPEMAPVNLHVTHTSLIDNETKQKELFSDVLETITARYKNISNVIVKDDWEEEEEDDWAAIVPLYSDAEHQLLLPACDAGLFPSLS
jgi:hypothetical protein